MSKLISFQQAIEDTQNMKRHLLLGNGFSIAACPGIFDYKSLFQNTDFSSTPEVKKVFELMGVEDFEIVIRILESGAKMLPIYIPDNSTYADKMLKHAYALRELLVSTIADNHPESQEFLGKHIEFWACQEFLNHFLGSKSKGHVFTLNYDLLLYWTLLHDKNPFKKDNVIMLNIKDGFGNDPLDPEAPYVIWQGESAAHSASIHFLHGALHLYDAGSELQKYTWSRKNISLVEQAREAILTKKKLPLFVAEGTSEQKKEKIRHNAYLFQCLKVLTKNAQQPSHCFFIFGHSLAENDNHIFSKLWEGKFKKLYVGVFGDEDTKKRREIIARAKKLEVLRGGNYPLEVICYSASSANVWGTNILS